MGEAPAGLSVLIPTLNKADSLRATLACLAAEPPGGLEVVVVDDGCTDTTPDVLAGFADALPLRVLRGPGRGRAAARNAAARAARRERLLFLDDDILTVPGTVAAHASVTDPRVATHGPLWEFPGAARWTRQNLGSDRRELAAAAGRVVRAAAAGDRRLRRNALERFVREAHLGSGPARGRAPWLAAVGASLGVARSAWAEAGGFDEGFGTGWGCEDLELGYRLARAGVRFRVLADAPGVHLSHARPGRWSQHDANFARFLALHDTPEVRGLPLLLGPEGSPRRYLEVFADASAG